MDAQNHSKIIEKSQIVEISSIVGAIKSGQLTIQAIRSKVLYCQLSVYLHRIIGAIFKRE